MESLEDRTLLSAYTIVPTDSWTDIQTVFSNAQSGDTITAVAGTYNRPAGAGSLVEKTGVTFHGSGNRASVFNAPYEGNPNPIFSIAGSNATLENITINASNGMPIRVTGGGSFYTNVDINNITINFSGNQGYGITWDNRLSSSPTTDPSIFISNVTQTNGGTAIHKEGVRNAWSNKSPFPDLRNTTFNGITDICYDMIAISSGVVGENNVANNLVINSYAPFSESIYPLFHSPTNTYQYNVTKPYINAAEGNIVINDLSLAAANGVGDITPEPGTLGLLALGSAAILAKRKAQSKYQKD